MTLSDTQANHPLSIQFLYGVGFGITMASALPSPSGQGSVLTDMVNKICTNKHPSPHKQRLQRIQSAWNKFIHQREPDDEGHVCLDLSSLTLDKGCADWLRSQCQQNQQDRTEEPLSNSVKVDMSFCKIVGEENSVKSILDFLNLLGKNKRFKSLIYIQAEDDGENDENQEQPSVPFAASMLIDNLPKISSLKFLALGGCKIQAHNVHGLQQLLRGNGCRRLISLTLWNCEFDNEHSTWQSFVHALAVSKLEELEFFATVDYSMLDMLVRRVIAHKSQSIGLHNTLRYLGFRFADLSRSSLPLLTRLIIHLTNLQGLCLEGCSELDSMENQEVFQIGDTSHRQSVVSFAHSLASSKSLFWLHMDGCLVRGDSGQIVLRQGLSKSKTLQVLHLSEDDTHYGDSGDLTSEAIFCIDHLAHLVGIHVDSVNVDDRSLRLALHKNMNVIAFNDLPLCAEEDTSQSPGATSISRILYRNQQLEMAEEFLAREEDAFNSLTLPFCLEKLNIQKGEDPSALFAFLSATSNKWHQRYTGF